MAKTMEELLASQSQKVVNLYRNLEVEGEVVSISDREIILDLGAKSEGVISTREIPAPIKSGLKVGSKFKAFVYMPENESGQAVLSLQRQVSSPMRSDRSRFKGKSRGGRFTDWSKFVSAQNQKSKLKGTVIEVNRGGLMVEVAGTRGFLPNSQVGFELLSKSGAGMDSLIGQDLTVTVIEVDQDNNKLIFSERGQVSDGVQKKLNSFKNGQKVKGKVVAILPFGLVVNVEDSEGLVFISDVSWEKVDDLSKLYQVGDEVEVIVTGLDKELGRLNLSIKSLSEDPFAKLVEKYSADEVVKGVVVSVTETGVVVKLDGVEGLLPASKMDQDTIYEIGKSINFLVDSVDNQKRRINLAPFVTSTAGLIYK
ncbi:MAG: S1 RNA-binding domain-containing protein [Candidatus Daviesbacteria bacterium]|nr:S1 RNA-binding domain-containing protein [Candidatus Daviesbacteria bacterium]